MPSFAAKALCEAVTETQEGSKMPTPPAKKPWNWTVICTAIAVMPAGCATMYRPQMAGVDFLPTEHEQPSEAACQMRSEAACQCRATATGNSAYTLHHWN
eukprot:gnl/TRDRNA2_/TRDRNA2_167409_c2_seq1.p4 gnl/TRDRNA2_/TRDRNA2_167409_c2~~gnl/TRDRNA2_/TRDRNA2_167409_c2_seq1.p4  ORF type:complete len:100 (-),score=14.85 gnl/TRDRNA2_/TRDRNA2_167409_c2_seq1:331-630(-)